MKVGKAHQRIIREQKGKEEGRKPLLNLDGCYVRAITRDEAASIILVYEWLGTMNTAAKAYYGLFHGEELIGAACFGLGNGTKSHSICEGWEAKTICLERGACKPHAPKNAGSYLVSHACKQASKDHGWHVFYAYSDHEAGEIGTIYQACNWIHIGIAPGRQTQYRWKVLCPDGSFMSSRTVRNKFKNAEHPWSSWADVDSDAAFKRVKDWGKRKYVHFVGDKPTRRLLKNLLKYESLPYPKR